MSIVRRRALIAENSIPYWDTITEDWDYIIDQTGKYENPIIVNEKNLYRNKLRSIANIRDMSKLVVGYYDETSAKLIWNPIDNSSKTIVKCNTSAYPINMNISNYIKEHPTADVFMKLPEFWWRCWDVNDNIDTVAFKFVTEEPTDNNNWFHWDGNIFIGVYKGYINGADNVKLLRSISGVNPGGRYSWENIKLFARNKGANYSLITYEVHCIMALLGYGFYGTTDVKFDWVDTKNSTLNPNYGKITGIRDGDGMTDTFENNSYVNYWGLEGWFGGQQEYIDNMKATGLGEVALLDKNSNTLRRISHAANPSYYSVSISKMVLGHYADLLPTKFNGHSRYGNGHGAEYADAPAVRGSYLSGDSTGWKTVVGSISDIDLIGGNTSPTSRLQYEGNNEQNTTPTSSTSIISSYVLDQTNANGDPSSAIVFDNDNSVILAIKAASDFYALENKDWGSSTPEFIKMSKTNKLRTIHGTTLDANKYDIFMKLPEFWWKYEIVDNNEDKVRFSFTMTNPNDDIWHHWEGDTFIGVYEGYVDNDRAYSRSGVITSSVSEGMLKIYTSNRGTGFKNINYDIHRIMCILGWGYLANLNYKLGPGRESKSYGITVNNNTGVNDALGFSDNTYTGINNAINFWGLEDWWGHETELLDDILFMQSRENQYGYFNRSIEITNSDGTHRSIDTNIVLGSDYFSVGKLRLGSDIDVIPKTSGTLYNDCSRYRLLNSSERGYTYRYLFVRSASYMSSYYGTNKVYHSGLNSIEVPAMSFATENTSGRPRLCYKGNYTIGEEFQV